MNFFLVYTKQIKKFNSDIEIELISTGFNKTLMFITPSVYFLAKQMYLECFCSILIATVLNYVLNFLGLPSEEIFIINFTLYVLPFALLCENIEENFLIRNKYILQDIISSETEESATKEYLKKIMKI